MPRGIMKRYDSTETEIRVGSRVAYNQSGSVVPGVVLKITNSFIYIRPSNDKNRIRYKWVRGSGYVYDGEIISKVKHGSSILVLDQYEVGSWYPEESDS